MTFSTSEYITIDNDRVDQICRRRYGTERNGNVELVLKTNPGLAELGPILPGGVYVMLPEISPAPKVKKAIRLWG